ncbi:MAG: hypothetical protein QOE88_589 [Verrucomicrobiota bacterium]|nr:hypothetical protein [Verrucomicrobiota bacterium]
MGESDGVSGSGGEGEAFGKPLNRPRPRSLLHASGGGCGIDWRSTSCQEKRKKRGRIANVAQKVEDDWSTSIVAGTKCLGSARNLLMTSSPPNRFSAGCQFHQYA